MALRDQPYLPLYVQDYLTDEKLNMCSPSAQGVYIKIMCILHKQETYGEVVLFKQKDKQKTSMIENFALRFTKLLPFTYEDIHSALQELTEERVLVIDGDKIMQPRMVKDNRVSEARSQAAKKGGGNPILFKQNDKQIDKQNPEYENEYNSVSKIGGVGEIEPIPAATEKPLHIREQIFISECEELIDKYGKDTVKEFYLYWTEPNKSKTKMRFERQATWDLARRIAIWDHNKKTNFGRNNGKPNDKTRHGKVSFVPGKLQGSSTL